MPGTFPPCPNSRLHLEAVVDPHLVAEASPSPSASVDASPVTWSPARRGSAAPPTAAPPGFRTAAPRAEPRGLGRSRCRSPAELLAPVPKMAGVLENLGLDQPKRGISWNLDTSSFTSKNARLIHEMGVAIQMKGMGNGQGVEKKNVQLIHLCHLGFNEYIHAPKNIKTTILK